MKPAGRGPDAQTARIELIADEADDVTVAQVFEEARQQRGEVLNLYRVLANSPLVLKAWVSLAWPLRSTKLDPGLRELAILRVAQLTRTAYEWTHHWPAAIASGVSAEKLQQLRNWTEDRSIYSDREAAVLGFADDVTGHIEASEASLSRLRDYLPAEQVVELAMICAFYSAVARVVRTFGVEDEAGVDTSVLAYL